MSSLSIAESPAAPAQELLAGVSWECGSTPPGSCADPSALGGTEIDWLALTVPGTASQALRAAGQWTWGSDDTDRLDGCDWWFRCRFAADGERGPWQLELDGLATIADVWLNGRHVLHSENMFITQAVEIDALADGNELVIRCAALTPRLAKRHPRPRWKSRLVRAQSLRWYRTTLLGRMPGWSRWAAPVGPWRPVRLVSVGDVGLSGQPLLRTTCDPDGPGGTVTVRAELTGQTATQTETAQLHVGDHSTEIALTDEGGVVLAAATITLPAVERWWPHTHGAQPLYPVSLELGDGRRIELGSVGFRTITVDRGDGGFRVAVNGVPIFCRGACWSTPDAVSLAPSREALFESLRRARDAGMNMLRVGAYTTYESTDFWDACDELGLLVWQDCMLASTDPPSDEQFVAAVSEEVRQVFGALARRPSLAVACGSSETYQQAAMFGLGSADAASPLLDETIPAVLATVAPDVPYIASSPSGGDPAFTPELGVAHYFGVGAYLRPLADARLSGVRFAAECLAFATPPERETVDEVFENGASAAGHDPRWKAAVSRDAGTAWDFEDVVAHYVRELFGVDPLAVRYADPERALDLARATVSELMSGAFAEWRTGGQCDGALILCWQDLWPGAGWGLLDALGRPKAPLYALRRVIAPTAVVLTDAGLSGLRTHVIHDGPEPFSGTLSFRVFTETGAEIENTTREIEVAPRGALTLSSQELLGGFRDLNHVYRFGPLTFDLVVAELRDTDGPLVGDACFLPAGPARPRLPDLGLTARAVRGADGTWELTLSSERFAQYVAIDIRGFEPSDSWLHIAPQGSRTVTLRALGDEQTPSGSVRALNGPSVRVEVARD